MRKFAKTVAAVLAVGLPVLAAGSLSLDLTRHHEINNCTAGGGDAGAGTYANATAGEYLLVVTDEATTVCISETDAGKTCPTGGVRFPSSTVVKLAVPNGGNTFSCRSSGATGDISITRF
jgi:hypothetical protein